MTKDPKLRQFFEAQNETKENLEAIQMNLSSCVDEGMIDSDDTFYNELLALLDETSLSKNWDELEEVITKAKILETDVDAFLSLHGKNTIALPWPHREA